MEMAIPLRVFVSYSWDSVEHKEWVLKFVNMLRDRWGVNAKCDVFITQSNTTNLNHMMVEEIKDSDYVLIILTESYAEKANKLEGGVGFETKLLISECKNNLRKIIAVVREKERKAEDVIPYYLQGVHYIDFSDSSNWDESWETLIYRIYQKDKIKLEPIGKPPVLKTKKMNFEELVDSVQIELERETRRQTLMKKNLNAFRTLLYKNIGGKNGIVSLEKTRDIEKIIDSINGQLVPDKDINLWWQQGYSNFMINKNIEKIDDRTWVIDGIEMTIEKVWLYICPNSYDRDYILLKTEPSPDFPIYPKYNGERDYRDDYRYVPTSMAGFFKNQYITGIEHDADYADINGEIVELKGESRLRTRYLGEEYFFIATQYHSVLQTKNDHLVRDIYESLHEKNDLTQDDIIKLGKLSKSDISMMYN